MRWDESMYRENIFYLESAKRYLSSCKKFCCTEKASLKIHCSWIVCLAILIAWIFNWKNSSINKIDWWIEINQCIRKFLFRKPKCKEICVENFVALKGITENSRYSQTFVSQLQARRINTNLIIRATQCPASVILYRASGNYSYLAKYLTVAIACAAWLATQFLAKLMNRACRRIQIFAKHSNYPIQQPERRGPNFRKHYKRRESAFYICQTKLKLRSLPIQIFTIIPMSSP